MKFHEDEELCQMYYSQWSEIHSEVVELRETT